MQLLLFVLFKSLNPLAKCLMCVPALQPCPEHTITPDMLPAVTTLQGQSAAAAHDAIILTSAQQCLTVPGYGWQAGRATRCGAYMMAAVCMTPCGEEIHLRHPN